MADQIRVNGLQHEWADIIVKIGGDRFHGFTAISYADKLEVGKSYGMGRHHGPRGRTRGKYSTEPVKLTGPKSTMLALRQALAAASPDKTTYGLVVFQITVQAVAPGDVAINDVIEDCRYIGTTASHEESPDPLQEEVELDCMRIRRNGLTLFEDSQ